MENFCNFCIKGNYSQSCSVSKETFDLTVTRWTLWFKNANIIILYNIICTLSNQSLPLATVRSNVSLITEQLCLQLFAYYFWWSLFQESEETIHSGEIIDTSYESQTDFHREKAKQKYFLKNPITQNQKNVIFQLYLFSFFSRKNFKIWFLGE